MSDETRERSNAPEVEPGSGCNGGNHSHDCGCGSYQHGWKEGYSHAIDAALKELESLRPLIDGFTEFTDPNALPHAKANMLDTCLKVVKELEKLRNEK